MLIVRALAVAVGIKEYCVMLTLKLSVDYLAAPEEETYNVCLAQ